VYYADGPIEPTNPDLEQEVGAKTEGLLPHYCGNPDFGMRFAELVFFWWEGSVLLV
jgi:hypothetical protein